MTTGRFGYLLRTSRPRFWLYLAGPVAVGVVYGARSTAALFTPTTLALFGYFLVPANVLLYGVNDVFDADVDAENPKKKRREVRYGGGRLVPGAVGLSAALAGVPLLVTPRLAWPWLAGFLLLGVAYSAPPLRLKTRPPLDSVSNGLYVLPGAAAYAAVAGSQPPLLGIAGGWLWSMAMHTFSAIPDIDPDRRAGIETTATRLGERRTYAYCMACWTLAAVAFALLDVRLGLLLGLYPVAVAAVAASDVDASRAYWWYPALNTAVGTLLTMGGLWRLLYG
ncbi:prenyltransferase [Haloplanus pelagicus]|jgi:4-hydroxybenzoate polyprenyltransferase|uniref:prenyltransferase n=1 Tax=Haloplanus pelagicus TaxID=2949995 RepID=UPI00203CAD8E|nr:prenyltransferase [Haloplanus sp. HW8-1]